METRRLGRTDLEVGVLGLGTEYLNGQEAGTYDAVLKMAAERGVNYVDALFAFPEYRERLGAAMAGIRDSFVVTGHIGCAETDGQYRKTRDVAECESLFDDLLTRLATDHTETVMIQFVDADDDYEGIMGPGGLYELADKIRHQGKARHIGISIHSHTVAQRAAASGRFDVIMYPMSIILAPLSEEGLFRACEEQKVGLVAMKPYAGGRLFQSEDSLGIDPSKLVGYSLTDSRVATVAVGVKDATELEKAIDGIENAPSREELEGFADQLFVAGKGDCVYCNHCLPCPAGINIAETMMYLDWAKHQGSADKTKEAYGRLEATASDCIFCEDCEDRCPFEVPVTERMREAVALFGS